MADAALAERLARRLHAGQLDKSGRPYVEHLERVVAGAPARYAALAWLHDAIEDGWATVASLAEEGVSNDVLASLIILTKVPGEAYDHYIERIYASDDPAALAVKVSDLHDNLRPGYAKNLPRYRAALARLSFARKVDG